MRKDIETTRLYSGVYPLSNASLYAVPVLVLIAAVGFLYCFLHSLNNSFTSLVWFSSICVAFIFFESFKLNIKKFHSKLDAQFPSKFSLIKISNDLNRLELRSTARVCLILLVLSSWLAVFAASKSSVYIGLLAVFVTTISGFAMISIFQIACFKLRKSKSLAAILYADIYEENTFIFKILYQGKNATFTIQKLTLKKVHFLDVRGDDNFSCVEEHLDFSHLSAEEVQICNGELKYWMANKQPQYLLLTPANAGRNALYVFVLVVVGSVPYEFCFS